MKGEKAMLQLRGSSAAVTLLLILFIAIFFISQFALQKNEEIPAVPQGGDLVIVGGTTAAFIAALEGSGAGAQVFLFANGGELLGDTDFLVTEGLAASSTPPQFEQEIIFSGEDLMNVLREEGKGVADPQLLEAFAGEADILYDLARYYGGVDFDTLPDGGQRPYLHFAASPGAGQNFRSLLLERAEKSGIIFRPERIREIDLSREENDERIQLIILENDKKEVFPFYAQGVILADGGYCGDIYHRHGYLPQGNLVSLRSGQKGEGLDLALALKADFLQTDYLNKKILLSSPLGDSVQEFFPGNRGDITFFNSNGQVLSGAVSPEEIADFILGSPQGKVFVLAPEETARENSAYFRQIVALDELLGLYGLKEMPTFSPQSTYYISNVKIGVDYTPGGLSVTPLGEVKNVEGNIIRGLYAAGEISGGLNGEGMLPGMALSETLFLAGQAGRSAADYVRR